MNKNHSSLLIGLIFILAGVGLLLDKMRLFDFGWQETYPVIFLLLAVISFISAFSGKKNSAFWGGVFGVLGVFYLLRNFDLIPFYLVHELWPIFLLALGLGFIALFIFNPREWGVLVPGFILTGLGVIFILESLDLIHDLFANIVDAIWTYWPLILVLIGIGLILGSYKRKEADDRKTIKEE
ncbi:hypothetical protein JXA02_03435 [candidate division KSB1 bacterium]|nr:hypothetical protein [candidate division KSB1 bacterium]RQW09448.1 MAG: hypothetical protein EH222_03870 [candidate division KSB1 bacterium]